MDKASGREKIMAFFAFISLALCAIGFYSLSRTSAVARPTTQANARTYGDLSLECFRAQKTETDLNYIWSGGAEADFQNAIDNLSALPKDSVARCHVANDGDVEVFQVEFSPYGTVSISERPKESDTGPSFWRDCSS